MQCEASIKVANDGRDDTDNDTTDALINVAGNKWAQLWDPEAGLRGREGDKICQLVADKLNVTSFPNSIFPRGIMVKQTHFIKGPHIKE